MADEQVMIEKGQVILKLNPKLYDIDTIYSASYVFLDRAYILLDGCPDKEVIVKIKPKKDNDINIIGDEFLNELINYANYNRRSAQTKKMREILLQRALMANDPEFASQEPVSPLEDDSFLDGIDEAETIDDPEGIALPWEEQQSGIIEAGDDNSIAKDKSEELDYLDDPEGIAVPWSDDSKVQEKADKQAKKPPKELAKESVKEPAKESVKKPSKVSAIESTRDSDK